MPVEGVQAEAAGGLGAATGPAYRDPRAGERDPGFGLHPFDVSRAGAFLEAVEAGRQQGFAYYLPFLLTRGRSEGRELLCVEEDGAFCVFQRRAEGTGTRLDLLLAPAPAEPRAVRSALERANDWNGDRSARLLRVDEADARILAGELPLVAKPRKEQFLYDPAAFGDLAGRRFRTVRRNVDLVRSRPDVEIVPFSKELAPDCLALLRDWGRAHRKQHGSAGGVGTSRRTLELAASGALPGWLLGGEVVRVAGRVAAFAFGGEIRRGVGCFLEAKSDAEIPGLGHFQRHAYLAGQTRFERVNDGSDAGRAGLRQLKQSLRPIGLHVEYRLGQRGR